MLEVGLYVLRGMVTSGEKKIRRQEGWASELSSLILSTGIRYYCHHHQHVYDARLRGTSSRTHLPLQPPNLVLLLAHLVAIAGGDLAVDGLELLLKAGRLGLFGLSLTNGHGETLGGKIAVASLDVLLATEGLDGIVELVDEAIGCIGRGGRVVVRHGGGAEGRRGGGAEGRREDWSSRILTRIEFDQPPWHAIAMDR